MKDSTIKTILILITGMIMGVLIMSVICLVSFDHEGIPPKPIPYDALAVNIETGETMELYGIGFPRLITMLNENGGKYEIYVKGKSEKNAIEDQIAYITKFRSDVFEGIYIEKDTYKMIGTEAYIETKKKLSKNRAIPDGAYIIYLCKEKTK